ncbi:MAG TPA: beta-ketoacyl-[acyl-carrier-protein] synthase family protein [Lacunisphaera sp.]|nr:beta-ketoacyl-[acyl-carrier-protein] synthase family protein [Lacunisphaera sp.]
MRRRVKITGMGPVTPAGIGREAFFRGINESVSRVRAITRFDPAAGPFIGAEVSGFDLKDYAPEENAKRLSRHTQFGLAAAILAMQDAGLAPHEAEKLNPTIVTGTSIMDIDKISRGVQIVAKKGARYSMPSTIYEASSVNVPGKIAEYLGVPVRMFSLQSSCCSGLDAIGQAADLIATGQSDFALTGGSEAPLSFHPLLEFNAAELNPANDELPAKSCRPFDLWRSTGVIGEGAAIFVLEPESSPRPALAWITGYGYANDPDIRAGSGLRESMIQALANACRRPDEVDYINAWGPGHKQIDSHEAYAIKKLFGPELPEVPVTSIKGAVGTALGASGAMQTASTILSLIHGLLPPTLNWETPDPNCPLNLSTQLRRLHPRVAIINSHGLSGSNTTLVLEKACPS